MRGGQGHSGTNPHPSPPQTQHQGCLSPCPGAVGEGLLSPDERGPEFLPALLRPGPQGRGTPCPGHHHPASPRVPPSESGTAHGPGPAAAAPGLRGSAPPAGPGRAPTQSPRPRACSHPRPSRIPRCCSLSHSARCGSGRGRTGRRLECRSEESRSHSHQTDTLPSHTVGGTAHPGREASTGSGKGTLSRGPGPPGSSRLRPSFLPGHCSRRHKPRLLLCPHTPSHRASDIGALGSREGRSTESPGPPTQDSLSSCRCAGMARGGHSLEEPVGSGSRGPHSH